MDEPLAAFTRGSAGRRSRHSARRALWLALVLALPGSAQDHIPESQTSLAGEPRQRPQSSRIDFGQMDPMDEEKRLRALNAERQKSIVSDTNKLLKLARELDAEVESSDPSSPSPAQLKRVGEIEKLAHSVKEKMSTSLRGVPMVRPEPPIMGR